MLKLREYNICVSNCDLKAPLRIALVADLHNNPGNEAIKIIERIHPDFIAVAGDLVTGFRTELSLYSPKNENAFAFLKKANTICPTFYSLGNHEDNVPDEYIARAANTGAILLDNAETSIDLPCGKLSMGGLSCRPDLEWLKHFSSIQGFKILLCHRPEYYPKYIEHTNIDIVLSGHTHGGQWRIGNQGVFAPGQGLFPRYSGGVYDDRLVISRGLANTAPVPRFGNPKEVVLVELRP